MRTTDTEHATPIAMPRLIPGSVDSVSRDLFASVENECVDWKIGDGFGSVTIVPGQVDNLQGQTLRRRENNDA